MTMVTVSTVGYGEVVPVSSSTQLQLFTSALILFGAGTLVYFLGSFTAILVEGDLAHGIWRQRMEMRLSKISNHIIVAGAGKNGAHVVRDLVENNIPVVAIDQETTRIDDLLAELGDKVAVVVGDALDERTLRAAGFDRATGLITALPDDRDNIFLCLTARRLSDTIRIVSKVDDSINEGKLASVGANSIVSPTLMGGQRMVSQMIRPSVVSLADALFVSDSDIMLADIAISPESPVAGSRLDNYQAGADSGSAVIVAVATTNNHSYHYNPTPDTVLRAGGGVIALGDQAQLDQLRALLAAD
jgi:voltage-gated potassium channel